MIIKSREIFKLSSKVQFDRIVRGFAAQEQKYEKIV